MDSDTVAESDMSLKSRSFLYWVNDWVPKIQDQSSKMQHKTATFFNMGNVNLFDIGRICFHGKEWFRKFTFHQNTGKDLTMKPMFDTSEKLITEQSDEIYRVNTINWRDSAWKHLSLIDGQKVVSLSRAKVYVFSDSVLCFGKTSENPLSNIVWEDKLTWLQRSSQYRTLDTIDSEPMKFEWNISQDSPHCSFATESRFHV